MNTKCGVPYKIDGDGNGNAKPIPPRPARWQLIFWDKVVFGTTKLSMERYRNRNLNYHQAEDCQIAPIKR